MDDTKPHVEALGLPVQGPHWHRHSPVAPSAGFFPLRLVLQSSGYAFELTRPEMLLGRHSSADIRLPLPDVSRRHCRFVFADGGWQVFDLNSLNGLFVNGERVAEALLKQGDVLRVGGFALTVELPGSKQAPPAAAEERAAAGSVLRSIVESLPLPVRDAAQARRLAG
jgi:predicted component of type VI protein secretion system